MSTLGTQAAGRRADDWVERVRAASDIVEVVGHSVQLKRVGRNWVGLCPFHQEKTPSFSVNVERQFYHCFSCKAGGDVFKFVQETEKVGFLEAVELLSRRAGIPVPERRSGGGSRTPLLEALEAAAVAYEQWLADPVRGARVRAYLEGRGLARETVRAFRLGLAPEGWENLAQRLRGHASDEVLVQAGLLVRREGGAGGRGGLYDRFRNRLMVPLLVPGGAVVGFGARALEAQDSPKYLNSPESAVYHKGGFLFAFDAARRAVEPDGEMVVVEGYFDAIALHQAGVRNTVATSGTALTADQARLLRRAAARVALTYDGDQAGQEAMLRSLGVLLGAGLETVVVDLPPGEDPDTLVRRGGVEAWRAARAGAYDPVEFVQRHMLRGTPAGGAGVGDPRERALQAVVGLGTGIEDPIRLRLLLERASQVFGMSEAVLARAVTLRRQGQGVERPLAAALREQRGGEQDLERRLLRSLLHAPAERAEARRTLSPEDFGDPACAALARWVWGEEGEEWPAEEPAASLARELVAGGQEAFDWGAEARGATRRMVERRLLRQLRERRDALGHAAGDGEAARLMREIDEIARALRELNA